MDRSVVRGSAWYDLYEGVKLEATLVDDDGFVLRVGKSLDTLHFSINFGTWRAAEKMCTLLQQTLEERRQAQEFHAEPVDAEVVRD